MQDFSSCASTGTAKTFILIFYVVNNFDVSKKNENLICNLINYIYNVIVIQLITLQKCG